VLVAEKKKERKGSVLVNQGNYQDGDRDEASDGEERQFSCVLSGVQGGVKFTSLLKCGTELVSISQFTVQPPLILYRSALLLRAAQIDSSSTRHLLSITHSVVIVVLVLQTTNFQDVSNHPPSCVSNGIE
jgi:hypothetical protein